MVSVARCRCVVRAVGELRRGLVLVVLIMTAVLLGAASPARAQAFTFQGRLDTGSPSAPATGSYDFQFSAYTALTGGTQSGSTANAPAVLVTNGLFTTTIDFGPNVFRGVAGDDRYIQISARLVGGGAFIPLSPRQKVTPAPYAIKALNENWSASADGLILSNAPGSARVFVNRGAALDATEFFGFTVPSGFTFGGMYANTADAGSPYYGYASAGVPVAYTYWEPVDSSWRLAINANTRLLVTAAGRVGVNMSSPGPTEALDVNGNAKAAAFKFTTTQTRTLTIPPEAFQSSNSTTPCQLGSGSGYAFINSGSGALVAPVYLPNGAVITLMTVTYLDNWTADLSIGLYSRAPLADAYTPVATLTTSGAVASTRQLSTSLLSATVNSSLCYSVSVFCSDWQVTNTSIKAVQLTYTVDKAD